MKNIIKILSILFVPIICAFITYLYLYRAFFTPYDKTDNSKKIVLIETKDKNEIAKVLKKEGLIRNVLYFNIILKLRGMKGEISDFGEYELSPSMTPLEIVKKLSSGEKYKRTIKILAGDNLNAIIEKLEEQGIGSKENLKRDLLNRGFVSSLDKAVSTGILEGYLSPSMYKFTRPITLEKVLQDLIKAGNKNWIKDYDDRARNLGYDKLKILILASILEKETSFLNIPKDLNTLRDISAVYHNRLKQGIPLKSYSAISYARENTEMGDSRDNLYDTFQKTGLPPTPICTPSKIAIQAALYPSEKDYTEFHYDKEKRILSFN